MAKVYCNYEMEYLDEGVTDKWTITTDCSQTFKLTRDNKWWAFYQSTLQPHECGTLLGVKCPYCGKEVNFYDPLSETSWRMEKEEAQ
ncbi:hypothetical protein [Enterococcus wangshanyuanii]|uniref:Uncharacterized protein n=1 Tax=Enterococcus wangshanyuanii TaxID=2005703 RepID=A0ABQ1PWZ8_9ENTE|nr:hypothetical protein [Enterococcus wangshanyuanii]GGD06175.1 hypothetical protein GCM10011573_39480 [Enterococcus wangshanyuanii]